MRVTIRWSFLIVCIGLIAACASDEPAPVEDRSIRSEFATNEGTRPSVARPAAPVSGTYRVQPGDTLYAIAFNHGVDYRDLAQWNHIPAPYRIYVGQELRFDAPPAVASVQPGSGNPVVEPVQDRSATTVAPLTTAPSPLPPPRPVTPPPPPPKS